MKRISMQVGLLVNRNQLVKNKYGFIENLFVRENGNVCLLVNGIEVFIGRISMDETNINIFKTNATVCGNVTGRYLPVINPIV